MLCGNNMNKIHGNLEKHHCKKTLQNKIETTSKLKLQPKNIESRGFRRDSNFSLLQMSKYTTIRYPPSL